jgi:hypothetical protein
VLCAHTQHHPLEHTRAQTLSCSLARTRLILVSSNTHTCAHPRLCQWECTRTGLSYTTLNTRAHSYTTVVHNTQHSRTLLHDCRTQHSTLAHTPTRLSYTTLNTRACSPAQFRSECLSMRRGSVPRGAGTGRMSHTTLTLHVVWTTLTFVYVSVVLITCECRDVLTTCGCRDVLM